MYLVGGIPTPLNNMKVSWEDYSQAMENIKSVPNHQPAKMVLGPLWTNFIYIYLLLCPTLPPQPFCPAGHLMPSSNSRKPRTPLPSGPSKASKALCVSLNFALLNAHRLHMDFMGSMNGYPEKTLDFIFLRWKKYREFRHATFFRTCCWHTTKKKGTKLFQYQFKSHFPNKNQLDSGMVYIPGMCTDNT